MNAASVQLGSLRCRVLQGGAGPPSLAVVLCHGYGAPGDDLVPLGDELSANGPLRGKPVRWVFPAAPLPIDPSGFLAGRAWWDIDFARLGVVGRGGPAEREAFLREEPAGLSRARELLLSVIEELSRTTALPYSRIVLGGFSQGAMLATDVALRLDESPAGLCILSGTLICKDEWARRAPRCRGLKVLQTHGRYDPLLPYENAVALRELLSSAGLEVDFLPFEGVHGIPPEAISRLASFLASLLPAP